MSTENASAFRLVTALFLRRFVDNDLLSPHADRHESLAVLYACVVSLAVFVTFLLTTYLSTFIQLPGTAALSAGGSLPVRRRIHHRQCSGGADGVGCAGPRAT